MNLDNLSILIVEPNGRCRRNLREVLLVFLNSPRVKQAKSTLEASEWLLIPPGFDVIFISAEIGEDVILEFIRNLKPRPGGDPPKVILIVRARQSGASGRIVSLYLEGVNGFISEPFTADELLRLIETVNNPESNTGLNDEKKTFKAATFLFSELAPHLDDRARQHQKGETQKGHSGKSIERIIQSVASLFEKSPDICIEAMHQVFEQSKPFEPQGGTRKKAAAKRVVHPGVLAKELMAARGLDEEKVLSITRVTKEDFLEILAENRSLDEFAAREFSRIFGKTSNEWMKLQREFDATRGAEGGASEPQPEEPAPPPPPAGK